MKLLRPFFVCCLLAVMPCVHAAEFPGLSGFINEMVDKHQFRRAELVRLFAHAKRHQAIIDAISRPATLKPWLEYRAVFVNEQRVDDGLQFWKLHAEALQRAQEKYGVPQEVIVALIGVETRYGENMGRFGVLDALSTLAFGYPRRGAFFRGELEQYLLLAREQGLDPLALQGSYAGALGIPQFMPSSYRKYAVDFDGDGKVDLLHDPADAIGSVANYLKQYGWAAGGPVTVRAASGETGDQAAVGQRHAMAKWAALGVRPEGEIASEAKARLVDFTVTDGREFWLAFGNFDVITRYNNSDFYAMSVFQLAQALRAAQH